MRPAAQVNLRSDTGNTSYRIVDPAAEEKIKRNNSTHNNNEDIYRDGIIDNFDNFKNPGYFIKEHWKVYFSKLVGPCSKEIKLRCDVS